MIDYYSVVRLVLKLFGVVLIVHGAISTATYLPTMVANREWSELSLATYYIIPLLTPFLFGLFLWLFPSPVANTIVRTNPAAKATEADWIMQLERIGISLLGLYLLYHAVSDLIYEVMSHRTIMALLGNVRAPDDFPALITATVFEIIVALLLILQSRGIVGLLRRARHAGTS